MTERTFEIEDARGKRTITLSEFKADLAARRTAAQAVFDAARNRDLNACAAAQKAMRGKFK
jgi:hypothetical protein